MSTVNGFQVGSETLKYNYESLENYNTPEFSTTKTYAVGDYVMYQGKLYKCTTAVTTAGSWSSSNWALAVLSDDVSSLNNALNAVTDTSSGYVEISYVSTVSGYKAIYSTSTNRVALSADTYYSSKVYPVTQGTKYRILGNGNNTTSGPFAMVGDANIVESGASYCNLLQVISPDTSTLGNHTVEATINYDGYLYVNHRVTVSKVEKEVITICLVTDDTLTQENVPADAYAVGIALSRNTIIKNGQSITFVKPSSTSGKSVGITLNRFGANNLLDIDIVAFGDFANNVFTADTTIFDAYTDNVGPFSIGRNASEGGEWAGGVHSKTVGGTSYATAEQIDFSVCVDGVDITNQNGVFFGNAIVKTKNSIYFPQTITGSDLSTATKAITENRRFSFEGGVLTVEVIVETVADTYISGYYGMQLQTNWATQFVFPMADAIKLKSEVATGYSTTNIGHLLIAESVNAHVEMNLCDDGIGTYKYNADGNTKAFIMDSGSKMYFYQIKNVTIPQGKFLFWKGKYRFEHC